MAVIPSGVWPISASVTSGTELASYLNDWVEAFNTQSASASRPATIKRGGVWAKTLGASDIALMLYDGSTDHEIGSIIGGSASFGGGTNAGSSPPGGPTVGSMWYDTGAGQLKIYDGANWNPVDTKLNPAPITLDTSNNRVGINNNSPDFQFHVGTTDFHVDNSGNIGIGVGQVTDKFRVAKSGVTQFILGFDGTSMNYMDADVQVFRSGNSTERMRIDSGGNVIFGGATSTAIPQASWFETGRGSLIIKNQDTFASHTIQFFNPYGLVGQIYTVDQAVTYATSSDYRLKENVVPLDNASDRLKQIPVHRFNFIASPDKTVDGFLAHEVQSIVPEAVVGAKDAMRDEEYEETPAVLDDDGKEVTPAVMGTRSVPDYQGIDQSKLVPLLTAALQEALGKIETLEANVAKLMKRKT